MTSAHADYIRINVTNQMVMMVMMMIAVIANNSELETAPLRAPNPPKKLPNAKNIHRKMRTSKSKENRTHARMVNRFFVLFFCLIVILSSTSDDGLILASVCSSWRTTTSP